MNPVTYCIYINVLSTEYHVVGSDPSDGQPRVCLQILNVVIVVVMVVFVVVIVFIVIAVVIVIVVSSSSTS